MKLRNYQPEDCSQLATLFYETFHHINAKDYTTAQLNAWATGQVNLDEWHRSFLAHDTIVATAICDALEGRSKQKRISTHASLTAQSFFARRGYCVVQELSVQRNGITLTTILMEKML